MTVNVVASILEFSAKVAVFATKPIIRPKNVFKVGDTKRVVIEISSQYSKMAEGESCMNHLTICGQIRFLASQLGARIVFIILKTENNLKKIFYKFYRNIHQYFSNM